MLGLLPRATVSALGSVLLLGLLSPSSSRAAVPADPPRVAAAPIPAVDSMWVWHVPPATELASTAAALQVSRVFVFVGNRDRQDDQRLRQSVTLLHDAGVKVFALSGEPHWTTRHHLALAWARRALALAPFDGLHLDVEPHALPRWKHHPQPLAAHYLELLEEVDALGSPVEVAVQFAYGRVVLDDGTNFADDILGRVDGVTVMSYRDTAEGGNGMIAIAQDWLTRADRVGVASWLSAETNALPSCPYCTFFEEGQSRMSDVLTAVDVAERADHPTYQGFAIEDLDGWLALGP
jgi:hypothetical protein